MKYWYEGVWRRYDGSDTDVYGEPCEPGHGQSVESGYLTPSWSYDQCNENPDVVEDNMIDVADGVKSIMCLTAADLAPDVYGDTAWSRVGSVTTITSWEPTLIAPERSMDTVRLTVRVECTDREHNRLFAFWRGETGTCDTCYDHTYDVPPAGYFVGRSHSDGTPVCNAS